MPISRSISSGLAPGFWVITSTSGGVGSGYASTFRLSAEWMPSDDQADRPEQDDEAIVQAPGDEGANHETSLT